MNPLESERTSAAISARLTVLEGFGQGTVVVVDRFPVVIGRGIEADIPLPDDPGSPTISRAHLRLTLAAGRLAAEDLSTNGTSIGDRLLQPGVPAVLGAQETVWLGTRTALLVETVRPRPARDAAPVASETALADIPLQLLTLGESVLRVRGRELGADLARHRKAFLLLVYLAGAMPHAVPVVRLWEVFWPDHPESGKQGLQTAVSRLRKLFRDVDPNLSNPVLFERQSYWVNPAYEVEMDAASFERGCQVARVAGPSAAGLWERALDLYGGDFLPGVSEQWVERRRLRLRALFLQGVEAFGELVESSQPERALEWYREGLNADPGWEQGHLGVMRLLTQLGRKHEALFHYHECERLMRRLYGQSPSPDLLRFYHSELEG
ncbi:MAG: FHA domain-containing protein [Armatimonadetes bacterium]|nr:FHA domain-containing protein [Armatimonadota bacterium]